jgi:hypothetical protein
MRPTNKTKIKNKDMGNCLICKKDKNNEFCAGYIKIKTLKLDIRK